MENNRLIIVDDEADAREMVGEYMRMHGFEVTLCDGGRSLREELKRQIPDLIVLDLNMPNEDGLAVVSFLKERYSIPVVMLTASASVVDRVVGLELGADDYVAKPCELRELLARIRSILRRLRYAPVRQAERRLAAIVSFDFVGFTRYIQEDENGTLAAMDDLFGSLISPSVTQRRGVLFKMLGDGALIEFMSVVDAVEWAVHFQRSMVNHPSAVLPTGRIEFRVGVAVGDVVVHQSDRLGEGVALAVRLQEVATPGAIVISDQAYQFIRTKTAFPFTDGGLRQLKNIAAPMNVWTWQP